MATNREAIATIHLEIGTKALHKSDWPAYLRSTVFKSSYNLRSLTSLRIDCPYVNELNTFQDQATKSFSALPRDIRCITDLSCSRVRRGVSWQINYNNTLYYSVKSSSKATQSSLIGTMTTTPALVYSYRQVRGLF